MVKTIRIEVTFIGEGEGKRFVRIVDDPKIGVHIPTQIKQMEKFFGDWDENGLTRPGTSEL